MLAAGGKGGTYTGHCAKSDFPFLFGTTPHKAPELRGLYRLGNEILGHQRPYGGKPLVPKRTRKWLVARSSVSLETRGRNTRSDTILVQPKYCKHFVFTFASNCNTPVKLAQDANRASMKGSVKQKKPFRWAFPKLWRSISDTVFI